MIIFIANQFIGDKISSGGDVLATEIIRRVKEDLIVLAPSQIHPEILKVIHHGSLIDTDNFKMRSESASSISGGASTVLHYFIRSWSTTIWLLKNVRNDDVIYLTGDFFCNALPVWLLKKKSPNIKVLANFYHRNPLPEARQGNNYIVSYFSWLLQGISLKVIRKIAYKVFVLSGVGSEELLSEGFSSAQMVISGAGINLAKQKQTYTKRKDQIVFVGRINITKGAFDLIRIFSLVHQKNGHLKLVMVGGSSDLDRRKLNGLIRASALDGVISYRGFVNEETKNRILSESKALVLPSKEEGFGIVAMEALAFGTPVVCYDLPALKAVFSKYQLVSFVKSFMEQKFADKIIEVVSEKKEGTAKNVPTWEDVYKIQSRYF